jgi:hypothetical protein
MEHRREAVVWVWQLQQEQAHKTQLQEVWAMMAIIIVSENSFQFLFMQNPCLLFFQDSTLSKGFCGSLFSYELDWREEEGEELCYGRKCRLVAYLKSQGAQMILISILIFFGF